MHEHLIEKEIIDIGIIAQYTKRIAMEASKAFELMKTVANNYDTWPINKTSRWIDSTQCIPVADGFASCVKDSQ